MNIKHVRWASKHSWYTSHSFIDGEYKVYVDDGRETASFTDIDDLKEWAGY